MSQVESKEYSNSELWRCPYCYKKVKVGADVCQDCGSNFDKHEPIKENLNVKRQSNKDTFKYFFNFAFAFTGYYITKDLFGNSAIEHVIGAVVGAGVGGTLGALLWGLLFDRSKK